LIKQHDGFVSVTDKSSPEIIYNVFGVSKKTYKKAIGALFKKRLIKIEDDGIKLI
jgi:predicted RNA-binding protein (virulence factor B family)